MPGRGHGRGQGWGRGRHAARFLEPFLLLLLLRQGAAHGYTLLDQLAGFGLAERNPSTIYRVLRDMEELGYVTSTWEEVQTQGPPRRVYQLTAQGQEMLAQHASILAETRALIDCFLSTYRAQVESPGKSSQEERSG